MNRQVELSQEFITKHIRSNVEFLQFVIRAEGLIPVSVGNIPLWGEIKGIKSECNSLAERTIPRTLYVGVRSFFSENRLLSEVEITDFQF